VGYSSISSSVINRGEKMAVNAAAILAVMPLVKAFAPCAEKLADGGKSAYISIGKGFGDAVRNVSEAVADRIRGSNNTNQPPQL
jgi:hypothetical protein